MVNLCECHDGYAYQSKKWGTLEVDRWLQASLDSFSASHYECCYFSQLSAEQKQQVMREYKRILAFRLKQLKAETR